MQSPLEDLGRGNAVPLSAPGVIPSRPGLYALYADVNPGVENWQTGDGPLYVGKDERSLSHRILSVHLGDTGRSTLRRSLGALLRVELDLHPRPRPTKSSPPSDISYRNYTFEPNGDWRLTEWMQTYLSVAVSVVSSPADREREVISYFGPPLSLILWENPWKPQVSAARKRCENMARDWVE